MSILLSLPTTLPPPASLPGRNLLAGAQERTSQWCQNHPRVAIPHMTLSTRGLSHPLRHSHGKKEKEEARTCQLFQKAAAESFAWKMSTQSSPGLSDHQ